MESLRIVKADKPHHIRNAHKIRTMVFQMEQNIPESLDFDELDDRPDTYHFVAYDRHDHHDYPIGTARVRFLDERAKAKIERVAVLATERGNHVGAHIMERIEAFLKEHKIPEVFLDAQESAWRFYEKLGYIADGEIFEEVGMPHKMMVKFLS